VGTDTNLVAVEAALVTARVKPPAPVSVEGWEDLAPQVSPVPAPVPVPVHTADGEFTFHSTDFQTTRRKTLTVNGGSPMQVLSRYSIY
jgi:hypothetical protein